MRGLTPLLILVALLPACASATGPDRRAYILAHPHGWLEITIADREIPDVRASDDPEAAWVRPEGCAVSLELNGEPFFHEYAYPAGESAPYRADTGFRVPVPVGETQVRVVYSGCRIREGKRVELELSTVVWIAGDSTHEVVFDGSALVPHPPRPNSVVTLEDIYEALTGHRSPAE